MPNKKILCVGIATLLSAACSNQHSDSASLRVIYETEQCGITQAETRLIQTKEELIQLLPNATLPKNSLIPSSQAIDETFKKLQEGFEDGSRMEQWILVAWGTVPHPGYQLVVTATIATFNENELILPVKLQDPDPERMYPQMVVNPCLVLAAKSQKTIESFSFKSEEQ